MSTIPKTFITPSSTWNYPSDFRVRIGPGDRSAYPDVTVVCDKPEFADELRERRLALTDVYEDVEFAPAEAGV